jgi:hypothetical protein
LGSAARDIIFTGSPAGRAYAIDASSGTLRWSTLVSGDGKTTVFQPATDGDLVVAGYTTFVALNTGALTAISARRSASEPVEADPVPATGAAKHERWNLHDIVLVSSHAGLVLAADTNSL